MKTETHNGVKFIVADDMILRWLKNEGKGSEYEPETRAFMAEVLGDGGRRHMIDVGASTGFCCLPFAARGHKVTALECNPTVAERLADNVTLNQLGPDVRILQVAASNENGTATFFHNRALPLTSGGSIQSATCAGAGRQTVETITLDTLQHTPVDLIKIDAENHDLQVLEGARRMIEKDRPAIVVEANDPSLAAPIFDFFRSVHYSFKQTDGRNICATTA